MPKQVDISPGRRMETKASRKDQSLRGSGLNQRHHFDEHQGPMYCQTIPWYLGNSRIKLVCFQEGCPGHLPILK